MPGFSENATAEADTRMCRCVAQMRPGRRLRRFGKLYYRGRYVSESRGEATHVPITLSRYFNSIAVHIPYSIGVSWARWIAGNAVTRRLFFTRDIRRIKDVYGDRCGIRLDDRAVHSLLLAKTLMQWRLSKLPRLTDRELERYVRVRGLEDIRKLNRSGRAVVLASAHYIGAFQVSAVLARLGFDLLSVRRSKPKRSHFHSQIRYAYVGGNNARPALEEISHLLKKGGMVYALLDGLQGKNTIVGSFLGRNCYFRRGFVELALSEGAAIVPVTIRGDLDGRILIDFDRPLTTDIVEMPAKDAAAGIIERYAAYLDTAIRTYPWCFDPARLDLFLRRTSVDGPDNVPSAAAS